MFLSLRQAFFLIPLFLYVVAHKTIIRCYYFAGEKLHDWLNDEDKEETPFLNAQHKKNEHKISCPTKLLRLNSKRNQILTLQRRRMTRPLGGQGVSHSPTWPYVKSIRATSTFFYALLNYQHLNLRSTKRFYTTFADVKPVFYALKPILGKFCWKAFKCSGCHWT